jgi:type VI secretion system protein ImpB
MKANSQKYLTENRAPRVQIMYDVEVAGEQKTVELPFVMGILADLSGHDSDALPQVSDRRFVDIDASTFDLRQREISPSLTLQVNNQISGDGLLNVDLQFRCMEDFRPDQVARQIPALRSLLEAREKLSTLLAYMDGKAGAEEILNQILHNQKLLEQVAKKKDIVIELNNSAEEEN